MCKTEDNSFALESSSANCDHQRGESIAHKQMTIQKPNRALNHHFSPNNYLKQDRWEAYTLKKKL